MLSRNILWQAHMEDSSVRLFRGGEGGSVEGARWEGAGRWFGWEAGVERGVDLAVDLRCRIQEMPSRLYIESVFVSSFPQLISTS